MKKLSKEDEKKLKEDNDKAISIIKAHDEARAVLNKPNYYAVLPAAVRYDKKLSYFDKIIYAEISALSNRSGFCYEDNDHFSNLFDCSPRTIRRSIDTLSKIGYIATAYVDKEGFAGVKIRRISIIGENCTWTKVATDGQKWPQMDKSGQGWPKLSTKDNSNSTGIPVQVTGIPDTGIPDTGIQVTGIPDTGNNIYNTKLPDWFGKTPLLRILKLWEMLFEYKFDVPAKKIKINSADAKIISELLEAYGDELTVAFLVIIHFEWYGLSGNDDGINRRIEGAGFPITWIPKNAPLYVAYGKKTLGIKGKKELADAVEEALEEVLQ